MKYRKKPVVVEAVQFTEAMEAGREPLPPSMVKRRTGSRPPPPGSGLLVYAVFLVQTPHGERIVNVGDWIVTYPGGGVYACPGDAFAVGYEVVD